jgi:hypothetical protein
MTVLYVVFGIIAALLLIYVGLALIYFYFLKPPMWKVNWGLAFIVDCTERIRKGEKEVDVVTDELEQVKAATNRHRHGLGDVLHEECLRQVKEMPEKGDLLALVAKVLQTKMALEKGAPEDFFAEMCMKIHAEYTEQTKSLIAGQIDSSELLKKRGNLI